MKKLILINGGIKSGKSSFALSIFKKAKKVYFIATAIPEDEEMKEKIELHKKTRGKNFVTIEEPIKIVYVIKNLPKNSKVVVDCVNIWVANMMRIYNENKILYETKKLCEVLKKHESIVVSNEVGMCLVSTDRIGRKFQELLGRVNQIIAKNSDDVYFMISGVSLKLK